MSRSGGTSWGVAGIVRPHAEFRVGQGQRQKGAGKQIEQVVARLTVQNKECVYLCKQKRWLLYLSSKILAEIQRRLGEFQ